MRSEELLATEVMQELTAEDHEPDSGVLTGPRGYDLQLSILTRAVLACGVLQGKGASQ